MKLNQYVALGLVLFISSVLSLITACVTLPLGDKGSRDQVNSVAVVVALTKVDYKAYCGWDGVCAGSNTDLNRVVGEFRKAGIERVVPLYNEKATTYAVIRQILLASKALEESAKNGRNPVLIIYMSGHGGETYDFFRKEVNSMNQTMCLWDGQMVDDLMWEVLLKIPKGIKVVHITDTCNSGTNYRGVAVAREYRDVLFRPKSRRSPEDLSCDFIHFGGCADGMVSKGNTGFGGVFTYSLFVWSSPEGRTYKQWFESAKARLSKLGQVPSMSVIQSTESITKNGNVENHQALK